MSDPAAADDRTTGGGLRLVAGTGEATRRVFRVPFDAVLTDKIEGMDWPERILLAVVFTDIVGSTEAAERMGDRAWCNLLMQHHLIVRSHLRRYAGLEMDTAGDGFFVVFDRPSRAINFAVAARRALEGLQLRIRVGVHAGECEIASGRAEGLAVHIAARVASAAGDGEIFVSNTVRDLLAGSSIRFEARDLHKLKGVAEPRLLYALQN